MASSIETQKPEVMVGDKSVSSEKLNNVRDAVCFLKWHSKDKSERWSGTGFYANVKLKRKGETLDFYCIITNYDKVFLEMKEDSYVVAVFYHESAEKETFEIPLAPFKLIEYDHTEELIYMLIFIDERKMEAKGLKPILADRSQATALQPNDEVYMVHHPGKMKKHYSQDKAKLVAKPFVEYLAGTLEGPPGSPVFVLKESKFLLVAMHSWHDRRKSVLVSEILDDLQNELSRILSHVNHSFTCRAYALYRRLPSVDTIDISIVLISEFVDEAKDILHLKDHYEAGYILGEKGMMERVHTDRLLEISLDFPGVEKTPCTVKVEERKLDGVGFVMELFKGIAIGYPALGTIQIKEVHRNAPKRLLWQLNLREFEEKPDKEEMEVKQPERPRYRRKVKLPERPRYRLIVVRKELSRIWSHLNHSFSCRAYALFRRITHNSIDISIVLISEFVDMEKGEDVLELREHYVGYEVGEKGMLKLVHTDRRIEVSLDFPGVENTPFSVKVEKSELDSVGFLIEEFKGTELKYPALGRVLINEVHRHAPNKSLWKLNVREEKPINKEEMQDLQTNSDEEETQVEYRTRKLSSKEISRMSRVLGPDWDRLAGLMDIRYCEREEILMNNTKYPDLASKAKKIFAKFNDDPKFCRHVLQKYLDEIERADVYSEVFDVQNENEKKDVSQASPAAALPYENVVLGQTPLSPREMYRLSWKIVQEWDSLAGLMGITSEERKNVRCNLHYKDDRARAEKILSIINCRKDFSRDKLVDGLRDMERLDLIKPILTGQSRDLDPNNSKYLTSTKLITTEGGVVNIDNFSIKLGPGCLGEDTQITLEYGVLEPAFKTLRYLGLIDTAPQVVKFLPDGLTLSKPADVAIRFGRKTVPDSEHFILHGSYNGIYEKTVWELVTNGIEVDNTEGVINIKITHFSFLSYIRSRGGKLARILGHLNGLFTCRAYSFYRRLPSMDTIDISVVLLSEFVDGNNKKDIKQLNDHRENGYVLGERGLLKPVHTNRRLEMCLDFPEIERPPFSFKVHQSQLDSGGFAVDHFKGIAVKNPAIGATRISEMKRTEIRESLWELNVCEIEDEIRRIEVVGDQSASPDIPPEVVNRTTKLASREIEQISRVIGIDWDNLAALMDIPYSEREEIRVNCGEYPTFSSKAKRILQLFNYGECFDRITLAEYFEELERHDLKNEILPVAEQDGSEKEEEIHKFELPLLNETPLSSREMYRLSQRLMVDWDTLAAFLGVTAAKRAGIRRNISYSESHSKAEKVLAIFNNMKDFSRQKLAECLKEIGEFELMEPVITGNLRILKTP